MKAVRIILHQTSANYRREETMDNKMTYPLPPISTVVGALHNACGYDEYNEMKVSIQGNYKSMHREVYTDYCFLNSLMPDRGILVKLKNGNLLSKAYDKVAKAKKQGSNIRKNIDIEIYNRELLEEYQNLAELNDKIKLFKDNRLKKVFNMIKKRKKTLADKKKRYDKKSEEYKVIVDREKEIKDIEKEINSRLKLFQQENYDIPISNYRTLNTSVKSYEILDDIDLILHISASDKVMSDIMENIYNLKSIGRSEDFVDVKECKIVDLEEEIDDEYQSSYSAYIDIDLIRNKKVYTRAKERRDLIGTKYYFNAGKYEIIDNKKIYEVEKKVIYASQYTIIEEEENLYLDIDGENKYIVNLL